MHDSLNFKLSFALECADSINWELTPDFKKLIFSDNFETKFGVRQADYGYDFDTFLELHLKPYKEEIYDSMTRYINGDIDIFTVGITMYDAEGSLRWLSVRGKFADEERKLIYGVSVDITEQKLLEQRLAKMAYIDSHTGLYRVEYLADAAEGRIETVKLTNIGLMMLNICRFRDINAVFGHERGSAILKEAAGRLSALTDNSLLAKMDSGEFVIIFNEARDAAKLEETARRICAEFEKSLKVAGQYHYISFNIGITLAQSETADFGALMKDAELAINYIKNDEYNNICVVTDEIRKKADDYLSMVYELRQAVKRDEFILVFQPIINGESKNISGAEALIRWRHPERGIVSPLQFIPLAEQSGLINQIGDFVLYEAVRELERCLEINKNFYISINVSVAQLMTPDFILRVQNLLEERKIPSKSLVIEVTESVFITDMTHVADMLSRLRGMGVRVSLDDFGTGYSSLSYLKKIPLDNLKIDQSFLHDVLNDPTSEAILKSIISLARNLNLSITAEGVETAGHLELLKTYGCDYLQGYYFSKPITHEELEKLLING